MHGRAWANKDTLHIQQLLHNKDNLHIFLIILGNCRCGSTLVLYLVLYIMQSGGGKGASLGQLGRVLVLVAQQARAQLGCTPQASKTREYIYSRLKPVPNTF